MINHLERLELMTSIQDLTTIKANLKNDVMDPMLNWQERMELYECIQYINIRIQHLVQRLSQRPSA